MAGGGDEALPDAAFFIAFPGGDDGGAFAELGFGDDTVEDEGGDGAAGDGKVETFPFFVAADGRHEVEFNGVGTGFFEDEFVDGGGFALLAEMELISGVVGDSAGGGAGYFMCRRYCAAVGLFT